MRVDQDEIPPGFIISRRNSGIIAYDPVLDKEIIEVELDVRRLLFRHEVYLRQFKLK